MIVGKREATFSVGEIPEIRLKETAWIYIRDWQQLIDRLFFALKERVAKHEALSGDLCRDMVMAMEETIYYLQENGHIEKFPDLKVPKEIKLWDKYVDLGLKYEGIRSGIVDALYKKCYPKMYGEMGKGAVMSHWGLTTIHEAVEYVMEYLKKERLLK